MSKLILPATVSTTVVLITGFLLAPLFEFRPLPMHMALHIGLMNVAAPLLAAVLVHRTGSGSGRAAALWLIAAVQIILLWAWHAPALQQQTAYSHLLQWVMHGSLFLVALCFWHALLRLPACCPLAGHPSSVIDRKARLPARGSADLRTARALHITAR